MFNRTVLFFVLCFSIQLAAMQKSRVETSNQQIGKGACLRVFTCGQCGVFPTLAQRTAFFIAQQCMIPDIDKKTQETIKALVDCDIQEGETHQDACEFAFKKEKVKKINKERKYYQRALIAIVNDIIENHMPKTLTPQAKALVCQEAMRPLYITCKVNKVYFPGEKSRLTGLIGRPFTFKEVESLLGKKMAITLNYSQKKVLKVPGAVHVGCYCGINDVENAHDAQELSLCCASSLVESPDISNYASIQHFSCAGKGLIRLSPTISRLTNLKILIFLYLGLTTLPKDFFNSLTSLEGVMIGFSKKFKKIPSSIGRCVRLRSLSAFNNAIEKIPRAIFKLPKLGNVDFKDNYISRVPEETVDFVSTENFLDGYSKFAVSCNPLQFVPEKEIDPSKLKISKVDYYGLWKKPIISHNKY